jgi:outer membrane receptor protein involved in Fe transport
MRFRKVLLAFLLASLVTAAPSTLFAQTETGRITGTVTDPSGSVVPGATITLTSTTTGAVRTTTSDSVGRYVIANVPAGTYTIKFELSGFAPQTANVVVTVGAAVSADTTLRLAGAAESVNVIADVPVVNTSNPEVSVTISEAQIRELPTITRNPYELIAIAGNVSQDDQIVNNGFTSQRGAGGYNINGQRAASTNVLLDGAANNDEYTGSVGEPVPLDAVQEFSVITSNFSAQYGRATGGIVNVITKSGSNAFHGTGYEFFRNEKMASRTVDQEARDITKDPFNRHQPGFSIGGPIMKDKAQFFVAGEFIRVRSTKTDLAWVPTPDFLARTAPATQAYFAKFPLAATPTGTVLTRGQMTGNPGGAFAALPAGLPVFQQMQTSIPFDAGGGDPQNTQELLARVDWTLGPNSNAYARYALRHRNELAGTNSNSPYQGFNTGQTDNDHNVLFSLTRVWASTLTSQSKVVFNRLRNDQPLGDQPVVPGLYFLANVAANQGGVHIALPGYLPYQPGNAIPFGGPQSLLQLYHDQTWLKGTHDLRFGGSFVRIMDDRTFGAYETAVMTLGTNVPNGLDNLVLGQLRQFQGAVDPQGKFPGQVLTLPVSSPNFTRNNRYNEFALYANDAWIIKPRVTASLGVRYEYYGVQHNSDPTLDSNFFYGTGSSIPAMIRTGSVQITPNSPVGGLWAPDKNNFAPRLGIAWDVSGDGRTSIRGGYGMAYERNFGNVTFNVIQNPPNYAVVSLVSGVDVPVIPIPIDNAGPLAGTGTKVLPTSTTLRHVDQNIKNAYAHFWSASFQKELPAATAVSVEYTGSKGMDQYLIVRNNIAGSGAVYLGDASPTSNENHQYGTINSRTNGGRSLYNGVTFSLSNRGLAKSGLSFTGRYTLSHAKDDLSTTFSESNNNFNLGTLDPFNRSLDYGDAGYDVRHRFAASAIWEIPGPKSGVMQQVAGGWQVNAIFTAQSGLPFTIYDCTNASFYCNRLIPVGALPSAASNPPSSGDPNTYNYIDLTSQQGGAGSYANPITGTSDFGPFPSSMTARNVFRAPGRWNLDTVFAKRFHLNRGQALQLRFELYNPFKHANLYVDSSSADISSFSAVTAVRGYTTNLGLVGDGQRRFQLGIKYEF